MYSHFSCAGLQAGKTLLMYASQFGHEESLRALIEKGANLEAIDKVRHINLQTIQACNNLILFSYYFFSSQDYPFFFPPKVFPNTIL
jgi:ankyrin repeat protein